jgi:hypothetical protein
MAVGSVLITSKAVGDWRIRSGAKNERKRATTKVAVAQHIKT